MFPGGEDRAERGTDPVSVVVAAAQVRMTRGALWVKTGVMSSRVAACGSEECDGFCGLTSSWPS